MNKLLIVATLSAIAFGQVILTAALEKPHQQSAAPPNDSHIAVIISHLRKPNLYPNVTEKLCGSHSWYELERMKTAPMNLSVISGVTFEFIKKSRRRLSPSRPSVILLAPAIDADE